MSFGFGIGDVVTLGSFAYRIYSRCKASQAEFQDLAREVTAMHIVVTMIEDFWAREKRQGRDLNNHQKLQLSTLTGDCQRVLNDVDALLKKHHRLAAGRSFGERMKWVPKDIGPIREAMMVRTTMLSTYSKLLTDQSTLNNLGRILEALNNVHSSYQTGIRQESVLSRVTIDNLDENNVDTWNAIDDELSREGIETTALVENRQFIRNWIDQVLLDTVEENEDETNEQEEKDTIDYDNSLEMKEVQRQNGSDVSEEARDLPETTPSDALQTAANDRPQNSSSTLYSGENRHAMRNMGMEGTEMTADSTDAFDARVAKIKADTTQLTDDSNTLLVTPAISQVNTLNTTTYHVSKGDASAKSRVSVSDANLVDSFDLAQPLLLSSFCDYVFYEAMDDRFITKITQIYKLIEDRIYGHDDFIDLIAECLTIKGYKPPPRVEFLAYLLAHTDYKKIGKLTAESFNKTVTYIIQYWSRSWKILNDELLKDLTTFSTNNFCNEVDSLFLDDPEHAILPWGWEKAQSSNTERSTFGFVIPGLLSSRTGPPKLPKGSFTMCSFILAQYAIPHMSNALQSWENSTNSSDILIDELCDRIKGVIDKTKGLIELVRHAKRLQALNDLDRILVQAELLGKVQSTDQTFLRNLIHIRTEFEKQTMRICAFVALLYAPWERISEKPPMFSVSQLKTETGTLPLNSWKRIAISAFARSIVSAEHLVRADLRITEARVEYSHKNWGSDVRERLQTLLELKKLCGPLFHTTVVTIHIDIITVEIAGTSPLHEPPIDMSSLTITEHTDHTRSIGGHYAFTLVKTSRDCYVCSIDTSQTENTTIFSYLRSRLELKLYSSSKSHSMASNSAPVNLLFRQGHSITGALRSSTFNIELRKEGTVHAKVSIQYRWQTQQQQHQLAKGYDCCLFGLMENIETVARPPGWHKDNDKDGRTFFKQTRGFRPSKPTISRPLNASLNLAASEGSLYRYPITTEHTHVERFPHSGMFDLEEKTSEASRKDGKWFVGHVHGSRSGIRSRWDYSDLSRP